MPALPPRSDPDQAPGSPGTPPTWTSSAKDMVGCALGPARLWFTVGFGILNEVYYPRVDIPQIRDLGFIVAGLDGDDALRLYTLLAPHLGPRATAMLPRPTRIKAMASAASAPAMSAPATAGRILPGPVR